MPLVLGIDIFVNLLDLLEIRSGNMQVIEGNGIVFLKKGTVQKNVVEFNLFADAQVGLPDQVTEKSTLQIIKSSSAYFASLINRCGTPGLITNRSPLETR